MLLSHTLALTNAPSVSQIFMLCQKCTLGTRLFPISVGKNIMNVYRCQPQKKRYSLAEGYADIKPGTGVCQDKL